MEIEPKLSADRSLGSQQTTRASFLALVVLTLAGAAEKLVTDVEGLHVKLSAVDLDL